MMSYIKDKVLNILFSINTDKDNVRTKNHFSYVDFEEKKKKIYIYLYKKAKIRKYLAFESCQCIYKKY